MTNEQIKKATIGANKDQAELVKKANLLKEIDREFQTLYLIADEQIINDVMKNFGIFTHKKIKETEDNYKKEILKLVTNEIVIAQKEGKPTSRLTSLFNKIDDLK